MRDEIGNKNTTRADSVYLQFHKLLQILTEKSQGSLILNSFGCSKLRPVVFQVDCLLFSTWYFLEQTL